MGNLESSHILALSYASTMFCLLIPLPGERSRPQKLDQEQPVHPCAGELSSSLSLPSLSPSTPPIPLFLKIQMMLFYRLTPEGARVPAP